jgi:hypothetical protein
MVNTSMTVRWAGHVGLMDEMNAPAAVSWIAGM